MTEVTLVATKDVTIAHANHTSTLVAGQSITVSTEMAESLLGSGNFNRVVEVKEEKKKRRGE